MATTITLNGTQYTLNQQGDSPPWGDDQNALLAELVAIASNIQGTGDILTTAFTISNNQASPANVTSLSFDTSVIRAAIINYSVYRSTNTTEESEAGIIMITYSSTAGTWQFAQTCAGTSGVVFTITNAGQIQYISTNLGGTNYVGKLKFSAKAYVQT